MESTVFETLLSDISLFVGMIFSKISLVISTITGSPILTLSVVAIPVVGLSVGLLQRLFKTN